MDVLVYLAAHSERVVLKEELMEAVWSGAFVEEGALSQAIHSLRKVLGDDARQPRYIQTIPKRGYRLVAPLTSEKPDQGITDDPEAVEQPSLRGRFWISGRNWLLSALLAAAFAGVIALGTIWKDPAGERRQENQVERVAAGGTRIVVLPFENLGRPEDAFFADGLTEEITKDLASFPTIQVISRTSAMQYRQVHKPLPEIGRDLGVDYVLEGTVRWDYGAPGQARVRITPQLIRVADDTHVWAEAFERKVEDIFNVQADISRRVVGSLGIALLPKDRRTLRPPPTDNLEAYRTYLRGLDLKNQPYYSEPHLQEAALMFERAVKLDPDFAAAWAELSQTQSYLAFNSDPLPGRMKMARQALGRALKLAPDLPAVLLAQSYFTYRCLGDFDTAHQQLTAVAQIYPNDAEVLEALGFVLRRQGRLTQAIEPLKRSFVLDPRTVKLAWAIAETYRALRDYEQADLYYSQAISLAPDQATFWEEKALNRLDWTGSVEKARQVVEEAPIFGEPGLVPILFRLDLYERKYEQALARVSQEQFRTLSHPAPSQILALAVIARQRLGDYRGALAAAKGNRAILEKQVAQFPKDSFYRGYLAVALAQLGQNAEAITQMEQAVRDARPDAFSGPRIVELQAWVDAIMGRPHEAVTRITWLLANSYQSPISAVELRFNPAWDSVRETPEFKNLFHKYDR